MSMQILGRLRRTGGGVWPLPYPGQSTGTSSAAQRGGVELHGLVDFTVNDNSFERLVHGVILRENNFIQLSRNEFTRVNRGIDSEGNGISSYLLIEGIGNDPADDPSFTSANPWIGDAAVKVSRSFLDMWDLKIENYSTGIRIENTGDCMFHVNSITVDAIDRGLQIINPAPTFDQNKCIVVKSTFNVTADWAIGIQCDEVTSDIANFGIVNNIINMFGANSIGISINHLNTTSLTNNYVHMHHHFASAGINVTGCDKAFLSCNTSDYTGPLNPNQTTIVAYNIANSINTFIDCNSSDRTLTGYRLAGANAGTLLRGNTIGNHNDGIFHAPGLVGTQNNFKNLWMGPFQNSGAWGNAFSPTQFQFIYDPNDANNNQIVPNWVAGGAITNWFDIPNAVNMITLGPAYVCAQQGLGHCVEEGDLFLLRAFEDDSISKYEKYLASNNPDLPEYRVPINWAADKAIMDKLVKNPALVNQDTSLVNFYCRSLLSAIGEFSVLENDANETLKPDSLEQDSLDYYKTQMGYLRDSLLQNRQLIDSVLTMEEKDSLLQIDSTLIAQLKVVSQQVETILEMVKTHKNSNADSFKLNNNFIAVTALYEENEKIVNDVYFSTVAKGIYTLDSLQRVQILAIAMQCPLLGGPAVYMARALYAMVADTTYMDIDVCNENGVLFRLTPPEQNIESRISIYPNPADGLLEVNIDGLKDGDTYRLEIYGSDGRRCISLGLSQAKNSLNTSSMGSNIYFIRVLNSMGECVHSQIQVVAH